MQRLSICMYSLQKLYLFKTKAVLCMIWKSRNGALPKYRAAKEFERNYHKRSQSCSSGFRHTTEEIYDEMRGACEEKGRKVNYVGKMRAGVNWAKSRAAAPCWLALPAPPAPAACARPPVAAGAAAGRRGRRVGAPTRRRAGTPRRTFSRRRARAVWGEREFLENLGSSSATSSIAKGPP